MVQTALNARSAEPANGLFLYYGSIGIFLLFWDLPNIPGEMNKEEVMEQVISSKKRT